MKNQSIKLKYNKSGFIFSILFLFAMSQVNISFADIYINEVLYDPLITESGGEAVELYNSGDIGINISGFTIKTESSNQDAILPPHAFIQARGYYLITDSGWDANKDSILFPRADHEEAITLKNSDSGVILKDTDGNILDRVGWGNPISEFYSIEPVSLANKTHSIQRIDYTGNNRNDFISAYPNFRNSEEELQDLSGNIFTLKVQIPSGNDYILNFSMETDNGNDVYLMPGKIRNAIINFNISDKFSKEDIVLEFEGNNIEFTEDNLYLNHISYTSELNLDYYIAEGNYSINLFVNDTSKTYSSSINFSVMPIMAFEIDSLDFECNFINIDECTILGDDDTNTYDSPTIKNIGNVPLDFNVFSDSSLEPINGTNYLSNELVSFSFDNSNYSILSNTKQLFNVNLEPGISSMIPFSIKLEDITGINPGNYQKQFVIMGVEHE